MKSLSYDRREFWRQMFILNPDEISEIQPRDHCHRKKIKIDGRNLGNCPRCTWFVGPSGYLANPALVFSFLETPLVFRALVFSYLVSFWCFGHFFWLLIVFLAIFFQTSSGVAAQVELSQQRFQNVRCPSFSAVYGCPIAMSCLHRDKNRTNPKIRFA